MILNRIALIFSIYLLTTLGANAQGVDTMAVHGKGNNDNVNAKALYYDAVRARNRGDLQEAEQLLKKVVQFDKNAAGAYFDLARIYTVMKKADDAEQNMKKAISLQPDNKWYKEQYAGLLMEMQRFDEAAEIYEKIAAQENNKFYLQTLAYVYQRGGQVDKAIATFDKLLKMYGNDEDILEKKLQLYLNNNELDKAVLINNELIKLAPDETTYYIRLAEMYNNNNEPEKAADIYRKAEKMFPDDPGIQLSLSEYYKQSGNEKLYKDYLQKVVTNNSLDAQSQLTILSTYFIESKDSSGKAFALEMAGKLAEDNQDDARLQTLYGDMLAMTGKLEDAELPYKRSLEIETSNFSVWRNLLSLYIQQDKMDSLIKYSDKALRIYPNQAILHYFKGIALNSKKEYDRAVNSIQRAIDMTPEEEVSDIAGMYAFIGDINNSLKNYEEADEAFDKALELDANNATTLNNYAYYLSVRGVRLTDAEKMSKRSLELSPDLPTFLDTYGWILYKQGNYKKAEEYIQRAIEQERANASGTLWEHLGDVQYKLGNKNGALTSWQKAKELGTEGDLIDRKIKEQKLYE